MVSTGTRYTTGTSVCYFLGVFLGGLLPLLGPDMLPVVLGPLGGLGLSAIENSFLYENSYIIYIF